MLALRIDITKERTRKSRHAKGPNKGQALVHSIQTKLVSSKVGAALEMLRVHYGGMHINMQTFTVYLSTQRPRNTHTALLIHGPVILICVREKNVQHLRDGKREHQDELTHTSTERFCVRSHTDFIMSDTCEGGQEPFLSPVLSIHASRGTRSLPSGWHKRPALLYYTHQQQAATGISYERGTHMGWRLHTFTAFSAIDPEHVL